MKKYAKTSMPFCEKYIKFKPKPGRWCSLQPGAIATTGKRAIKNSGEVKNSLKKPTKVYIGRKVARNYRYTVEIHHNEIALWLNMVGKSAFFNKNDPKIEQKSVLLGIFFVWN